MKKIKLIAICALLVLPMSVGATNTDVCDQVFDYTKSSDFSDARVSINFESNDHQIDVSAQSGYEVVKVELDVENDNQGGYFQYSTGSLNNFNPNPGNEIDSAKVRVKKTCPIPPPVDLCPEEGVQTTLPCAEVPPPTDLCPEEGVQTVLPCADVPSNPTPEPTPTPSSKNEGSTQPGGRRHCGTINTPTCEEWVKGIGTTSVENNTELKLKLIDLMKQLVALLNLKIQQVPHDFKG